MPTHKAKKRLAVITLHAGEEFAKLASIARPGIEDYCNSHGYDFIEYDTTLDAHRPPSWSKIIAIQNHLEDYDYVFWLDTDCVILNRDEPLTSFIDGCDKDIVISRDENGLNCGAFFVRSSAWSNQFLRLVYACHNRIHDPWWESRAFMDLYANSKSVKEHMKVYGADRNEEFTPRSRASFNGYYTRKEWSSLIMHFPGVEAYKRIELMPIFAKKAWEPKNARLFERNDLGWFLNDHGLHGEGAEIGVADGTFSQQILSRWSGHKLNLVDAWRHLPNYDGICNVSDEKHQANLYHVIDTMKQFTDRTHLVRELSCNAVTQFKDNSLDFVYLDANPAYRSSCEDLRLWYPKVRPGGLFSGHDYVDGELPEGSFGVKAAVDEFARAVNTDVQSTVESEWRSWYFFKPVG